MADETLGQRVSRVGTGMCARCRRTIRTDRLVKQHPDQPRSPLVCDRNLRPSCDRIADAREKITNGIVAGAATPGVAVQKGAGKIPNPRWPSDPRAPTDQGEGPEQL